MVVVRSIANDVGVLAVWEVESLDGLQLNENLEGPEDRCAANPKTAAPGGCHEFRGREVAILIRDQHRQGAPGLGQPIAGLVEGRDNRYWRSHA